MSEKTSAEAARATPAAVRVTAARTPVLQRVAGTGASAIGGVPSSVHSTLRSPGAPLDAGTRSTMESRFGHDFGQVRVHSDANAALSAHEVGARAYTVGQDVVFGSGHFAPHTAEGQHLLAHELAHTLQQRGLQRAPERISTDQGPEYHRLEREAESAAAAVMRGGPVIMARPAGQPTLSKAGPTPPPSTPASAPAPTTPPAPAAAAPIPVTVTTAYMTTHHDVTPEAGMSQGARTEASYVVDKLFVPTSKGQQGYQRYQSTAGGALQTVLTMSGTQVQESAAWQERDDTAALRSTWLQARRLAPGPAADAAWIAAGGQTEFPVTAAGTAQMDHIVELQLGGGNNAENIQPLEGDRNRDSGGALKYQIWGLAHELAQLAPAANRPAQIRLRFAGVGQQASRLAFVNADTPSAVPGATPAQKRGTNALSIAQAMTENLAAGVTPAAGSAPAAAATQTYTLTAGGANAAIQVPANFAANTETDIYDNPANRRAGLLITGLLLSKYKKGGGTPAHPDKVTATLDTTANAGGGRSTRLPLSLTGAGGIEFSVAAQPSGAMHLLTRTPALAFTYPYLSPGRVTSLSVTPDGATNWRGEIIPSIPFLPRPLTVAYENGIFRVTSQLNPQQLRSPIPGFTITSGGIDLILAPDLSASGRLAFALGSAGRPIATGSVEVGADANGLHADGTLEAHIPGVDNASGALTYRNGQWAAQIVVESSRINLPYVQSGRLQLDIGAGGIEPSGELRLLLPRDLGDATLGFHRENGVFVYTGGGRLRVPGLHEVDIRARYDGTTLTATASNIGFTWHGLDGHVSVTYTARRGGEGAITGAGAIAIRRGNVTGSIDVTLHDSGRFSGRGRVTYPFNIHGQRIEASAGVIVDEQQNVRVEGSLRLPQPIELFRRFGDTRTLFHIQRNIPIPGLSIGPVGLVAVLEGGISARYGIGPGQLRNVEITAAFNPLAPEPDPDVAFHCELYVPASAGISGTIGGGLGVDAGIASVTGTLTVTAALDLNAVIGSPLDLHYAHSRFEVSARPGLDASLDLGLSLDAHARAEAGVGWFTIGTEKNWNLGRRSVTLGHFSMFAPMSWTSDGGFTPPSMDQIEWGPPPQIDPGDLLRQLFSSASASERQDQ